MGIGCFNNHIHNNNNNYHSKNRINNNNNNNKNESKKKQKKNKGMEKIKKTRLASTCLEGSFAVCITIDDIDSVSISWSPPVYSNHAFLQGLEPDASEEALCFCEAEIFGQVVSWNMICFMTNLYTVHSRCVIRTGPCLFLGTLALGSVTNWLYRKYSSTFVVYSEFDLHQAFD